MNLSEDLINEMREKAREELPKPGTKVQLGGQLGVLRWIDNPWFEDGRLADLLIRVSFDGGHGTWHRLSQIEILFDNE